MKTLVIVLFALFANPVHADTLDEERLTQALLKLPQTRLQPAFARQLVSLTTTIAADADIDPTILLAQIWIESRFTPDSTSRLIDGERQTGRWPSRKAPEGWHGTLYCGISQTVALTWKRCLELRDNPELAIRRQAEELGRWLKRTRGDLDKALGGYGCGNAGLTNGCRRYPQRVQALAKKLRARAAPLS